MPLLKSETGDKLGKTAGDPLWLSSDRTSVFDFYQARYCCILYDDLRRVSFEHTIHTVFEVQSTCTLCDMPRDDFDVYDLCGRCVVAVFYKDEGQ